MVYIHVYTCLYQPFWGWLDCWFACWMMYQNQPWRRSRPLGIRVLAFGVPGALEGSIFGMLRDVRIFLEDISMYFIHYFIQTWHDFLWFFDRGWSNKILCYTRAGDYCGGVAQVFCRLFRTARCLAWSRRFEQVSFLEKMYRDIRDHKRDLNVTQTHIYAYCIYIIHIYILYIYIYYTYIYILYLCMRLIEDICMNLLYT